MFPCVSGLPLSDPRSPCAVPTPTAGGSRQGGRELCLHPHRHPHILELQTDGLPGSALPLGTAGKNPEARPLTPLLHVPITSRALPRSPGYKAVFGGWDAEPGTTLGTPWPGLRSCEGTASQLCLARPAARETASPLAALTHLVSWPRSLSRPQPGRRGTVLVCAFVPES